MSSVETHSAVQPPRSPFQFGLRTLLLLFVVLASSLGVFGAWGVVVFVLLTGLTIYIRVSRSMWPLGSLILLSLCAMCLWPAISSPVPPARRSACLNNLKQLALALHNYHAVYGSFPPAYVSDSNGKPMHSWRTLILPYLHCNDIYALYDFTQLWDAPKNKSVSAMHLREFLCPGPGEPNHQLDSSNQTSYVAVVGPDSAWTGDEPRKLTDFNARGLHSTIMLVEVADSGIAWTEPRDLSVDELGTASALTIGSRHGNSEDFFFTYTRPLRGACVASADGSVHYLPRSRLTTKELKSLLRLGEYKDDDTGSDSSADHVITRPKWPNIAALAVWLLSVGVLLVHAVRARGIVPTEPADLIIDNRV